MEHQYNLTVDKAVNIVGKFIQDWKQVPQDSVTISRLENSFNNLVYHVSTSETIEGPSVVVIHVYGGNILSDRTALGALTESEKAVLVCKLGDLGLGPKIYGFFDGGRV